MTYICITDRKTGQKTWPNGKPELTDEQMVRLLVPYVVAVLSAEMEAAKKKGA